MAARKISPSTVFLFIDPTGGTTYDTLVCLNSFKFTRNTNIIDSSTMCGPDKTPGPQDVSISFDGEQELEPGSGKVSGADLDAIWLGKTTVGWKIAPATPVTGDVTYAGTGFIAKLDEDYTKDKNASFGGEIGVYGTYTRTVTS